MYIHLYSSFSYSSVGRRIGSHAGGLEFESVNSKPLEGYTPCIQGPPAS